MKTELSIITVDYNSSKYLIPCINTIKNHLKNLNYEIVVVDNASKENHLAEYEKIDPDTVRTFRTEKNLGFGGGNNYGVSKASGRYVLLLNPDTEIVDDSILKMFQCLESHPEIGALTCLLIQEDKKTIQENYFGRFQTLKSIISRSEGKPLPQNGNLIMAERISAAAMMLKKTTFEQAGGFDENFFMYMEDDDLCKKITILGFSNAVYIDAKIIHYEGKSSLTKQKKNWYYRSQSYFWKKHYGLFATIVMQVIRWPYKIYKLYISV